MPMPMPRTKPTNPTSGSVPKPVAAICADLVPLQRLGPLLRALREESGLKQLELAKRSGAWPGQISRLETSQGAPTQEYIEQLCAAMGLEPKRARLLKQAAARDVVLLESARRGFDWHALAFISACLDAVVLLPADDLAVIGEAIKRQVKARIELMRMVGQCTFVEDGR